MKETFQHKKNLQWLLPAEFKVVDEYRIYAPRERTDLSHSIDESHIIEPFTAIKVNDEIVLINGFDRFDVINAKALTELKIPTWVIEEPLSTVQVKKLILDLGRQKQKTYSDYLSEFEIYNMVVPNEQGKKLGGHNRFKIIAALMGISPTQLSKLQRINSVRPTLISQVDNGHATLVQAEQKAKQIKREQRQETEKQSSNNVSNAGKVVDMNQKYHTCPTCKRPLSEMEWKDLPDYFTYKRDESNNQTDWLQPLTEEVEEILKNESKTVTDGN